VKFAVRGGGHTLNSGAANITDGVVISLRALNSVTFNEDKSVVSIGGGAKWGEVYHHLDALGLATSGGRVSSVGVGGLCLGGGISYFSAREGLVCDNIVSYEMVLSSGAVVIVSKTSPYSDLWRALKGGSSNFGIVTRFDIRTFSQGPFYGGVIASPISTLEGQIKGFVDLLEDFDPFAAIILSMRWNKDSDSFGAFCNLEYTKDDSDPVCLRPFTSVQPQHMNTMRISTLAAKLSDFDDEAGKYVKSGLR
jgi:FAD/FMN-containing dehydrogenase